MSGESGGRNALPLVTQLALPEAEGGGLGGEPGRAAQRGHELFHRELAVVELFEHLAAAVPGLEHAPEGACGHGGHEAEDRQREQQLDQREARPPFQPRAHQRVSGFRVRLPSPFFGT